MLRKMTPSDVLRCFEVRTSTTENALTMEQLEEWYDLTPESLSEGMGETLRGWVYEEDEEIVGFSMADSIRGELMVIAVLPTYEGKGIGRALLSAATNWLTSSGGPEP